MLDEHLLNSGFGEIRVNRRLALAIEFGERLLKRRVRLRLVADEPRELFAECRHFTLEFGDSTIPIRDVRLFIVQKGV